MVIEARVCMEYTHFGKERHCISNLGWSRIRASILLSQGAPFRCCCSSPRSASALNLSYRKHPTVEKRSMALPYFINKWKTRFDYRRSLNKKTYCKYVFILTKQKYIFSMKNFIEWKWKIIEYKYISTEYKYIFFEWQNTYRVKIFFFIWFKFGNI